MWIERTLASHLAKAAKSRPVVVLTGARQTGKTSLLRRLFAKHSFVSLDLPSEAELAERDPQSFVERFPLPVLIDEVQYAPRLFRHVKSAVDANRKVPGQFILTGSQKFVLMQEIADSLAGRVSILELESLSVSEILNSLTTVPLERLILRGGYPELWEKPELDGFQFYRSYAATYLERDVRTILNVGNLRDFERFLRACALRTGQLLNKADLARDVGISPSTANQWISVMQTAGQVFLLEPWFSNKTKSMVKTPKLYFADTGLLAALLNIQTLGELLKSPLIGPIWETFVFAELRKREVEKQGSWSIYFWHDRSKEVDFLIDRGGRFELYDAKWTEHPDMGDTSNLIHVEKQLGIKNVVKQHIVSRTPNAYPINKTVKAISLHEL